MADIKTRNVARGTIKTLDKGASAMHRMKEETIRSKAAEVRSRSDNEPSDSYAQETLGHYVGDSTAFAAGAGRELMLRMKTGTKGRDDQIREAFRNTGLLQLPEDFEPLIALAIGYPVKELEVRELKHRPFECNRI